MLKKFIMALHSLTLVTVQKGHNASEHEVAESMAYFPIVGFGLGCILVYADKGLLWILPHSISNALLIVIAVILTRAMHIAGLADTLDGLTGGNDNQPGLPIMKKSGLGTAGAIGIMFLLLIKYVALNNLFSGEKVAALLIAPLLARWSQALMAYRSAYGREQGADAAVAGHLRGRGIIAASVVAIGLAGWVSGSSAFYLVTTVALFTLLNRWYFSRKPGGVTGSTLGAVSELNEVLVLLLFVILSNGE